MIDAPGCPDPYPNYARHSAPSRGSAISITALPTVASGSCDGPEPRSYIIYDLHDRETDRHYVGLTRRSLPERIAAHRTQARRDRKVRSGGLMERLRPVAASGAPDPFIARIVAYARDVVEARAFKRLWIVQLSARFPSGFNLMPGARASVRKATPARWR